MSATVAPLLLGVVSTFVALGMVWFVFGVVL